SQLIETVYRIEFPSAQQPQQIKGLAQTCGWNIDNQLAENVIKMTQQPAVQNKANDTAMASAVVSRPNQTSTAPQVGFTEQKFEASPLDELAKLELNDQEQN